MGKLLFDEQPLVIDKGLASLIGLNEAIVLQQIHYWLEINKKANKNFYEKKYWTYNTIEKWREEFPFWSADTVKRTLSRLRKMNVIITGNFNKMTTDRTLWYTIDYDRLEELYKTSGTVKTENRNTNEETEKKEIKNEEGKEPQTLENTKSAKCPNGENTKSADCPDGKNAISAKCPNASGQNAPMHWGILHRPLPEITTENNTEISFQSVGLSENNNTDGPTDKKDIQKDFKRIMKKCEVGFIDEKYRDAVRRALWLLYFDSVSKKSVKIGDNIFPAEMVRADLEKLDFLIIDHALNKFKEASGDKKIKNTVSYLKTCIYNALSEMNLDVENELRYKKIIN